MIKKQKKIMVWLIVWAGLLIVVLYSPIGSPDLYSPTNYYFINQTVPVEKGAIVRTPKRNFESENNSNDAELPDISSLSRSNNAVGNYLSANTSSQGSYNAEKSQSYQNNNSSGSGNNGIGVSPFLTSGSSHSSFGTSGISMSNGMSTLSLTMNLTNNGIAKESINTYTSSSGGTDPGGDPPGDPIPVGEGWEIFMFSGLLYSFIKILNKRDSNILSHIKNQIKKTRNQF